MKIIFALFALLLMPMAYAQSAGRVLIAVGDVVVERSGRQLPLMAGDMILGSDTVRLGAESNAQIRFSDESIVALRSRSVFHIDRYEFSGRDDATAAAVFSLLSGGMRTISGAIGKLLAENYRVRTKNATVGIRGTHYTLTSCQQDCFNADGSLAADGDYGGVLEGRVAVNNQAGEREFGEDEYFFVPNIFTAPQLYPGRPAFLRDRLDARNRKEQRPAAPGQAQAQANQANQAKAASVALDPREIAARVAQANAATKATVSAIGNLVSANNGVVAVDLRDDSGNIAVLGAGLGLSVAAAGSTIVKSTTDGGTSATIIADPKTGVVEKFRLNGGLLSGTRDTATTLDKGGISGDGSIVWARWSPGGTLTSNNIDAAPVTGVHYIFGNLTPPTVLSKPVSAIGVASSAYDYVGGTNPTNGAGQVGQMLSGSFSVDFLAKTISGSVAYKIGNFSYVLPVATGTSIATRSDFIGFIVDARNSGSWTSGTQSGALDSYSISGLFLGSRAQGLGVTFATLDAISGKTAGAEAFKCRACKP